MSEPAHAVWPALAGRPELPSGAVHVVRLGLDEPAQPGRGVLSATERARAQAVADSRARARFVAARGGLRRVLGAYLGVAPERLCFATGAHGKPCLAGPGPEAPALRFSLSHSHDAALIALARGREVGVDVERLRPRRDLPALAARWLGPEAAAAVATVPESDRKRVFYRLWARHEALVKCAGTGLGGAFDAREMQVCDLPVGDALAAALAVQGREEVRLTLLSARA